MRKIEIGVCFFSGIILLCMLLTGCGKKKFELIEEKCGRCHESSIVYEKERAPSDWDVLIFGMKSRGLKITAAEEKELMTFLNDTLTLK